MARGKKLTVADSSQRLIDATCAALRAADREDIGDYLVSRIAGTGRLFLRQGDTVSLRTEAEIALRRLIEVCVERGVRDEVRRGVCFDILRDLERRPGWATFH